MKKKNNNNNNYRQPTTPPPLLSVWSNMPIICNYQAKTADDFIKKHFLPPHNHLKDVFSEDGKSLVGKLLENKISGRRR